MSQSQNAKKEKSNAQFHRTVNKTGKWRGKTPEEYRTFKSGTKNRQKLFTSIFNFNTNE